MALAPSAMDLETVQSGINLGILPGEFCSYPVDSYARRRPQFFARCLEAGMPNSGSKRMALEWGGRILVSAVLNSSIMPLVTWEGSQPFSLAMDFFGEPR